MSYLPRVTSVASIDTFLQGIINFAVSNASFANEGNTTIDSDTLYRISKGGIYWGFRKKIFTTGALTMYGIDVRMTTVKPADGGADFYTVDGMSRHFRCSGGWTTASNYTSYYGFHQNDCVHAVLEFLPGTYTHLSFGKIDKYADAEWTGGEYVTGSGMWGLLSGLFNLSGYRVNVSPFGDRVSDLHSSIYPAYYAPHMRNVTIGGFYDWARESEEAAYGQILAFGGWGPNVADHSRLISSVITKYGYNSFNLRSILFTLYVRLWDDTLSNWRTAGEIPGVKYLNITGLSNAQLTDNDWQVFPMCHKSTALSASYCATGNVGYAYYQG